MIWTSAAGQTPAFRDVRSSAAVAGISGRLATGSGETSYEYAAVHAYFMTTLASIDYIRAGKRKARRRNEGLVKLLLACPAKGWFRSMDRAETTDDLKTPRLG